MNISHHEESLIKTIKNHVITISVRHNNKSKSQIHSPEKRNISSDKLLAKKQKQNRNSQSLLFTTALQRKRTLTQISTITISTKHVVQSQQQADLRPSYPQQQANLRPTYPQQQADLRPTYPQQQADLRSTYPQQQANLRPSYPQQQAKLRPSYPQQQENLRPTYPQQQANVRPSYPQQQANVRPSYPQRPQSTTKTPAELQPDSESSELLAYIRNKQINTLEERNISSGNESDLLEDMKKFEKKVELVHKPSPTTLIIRNIAVERTVPVDANIVDKTTTEFEMPQKFDIIRITTTQ
ncbi:unnamed protein product [Thelazia callipaeda]|uniref:MSP domain-containing protein n=1 Tax=Thelazia callipaeda TaxID=103827 RepID=A0A0N5D1T0_THECL|nr:unnamed protein product [Thelazia callipaeda]